MKNKIKRLVAEIDEVLPILKGYMKEQKDPLMKMGQRMSLFTELLTKTIAQYSIQEDSSVIKETLNLSIDSFLDDILFEEGSYSYDKLMWIFALAILYDIEQDRFEQMSEVIKLSGVKDNLLDIFIQYKIPSWEMSNTGFVEFQAYKSLNGVNTIEQIKPYLKNWYKNSKNAFWYDQHKNTKVNNFYGYWAWEAAALVKVYGLDDSELKDTEYYPYDAVHWNDGLFT